MNTETQKHFSYNVSLLLENIKFHGTGGISRGSRQKGFIPGFLDTATGTIYRSRFTDGRPAPIHVLEGLPTSVVFRRTPSGNVDGTKISIISGFIRNQQFYTREQAAIAVDTHGSN